MLRKLFGVSALAGYIATIWAANYAVNHWGIVSVPFGLVAPAGVYFAGVAFTLRDVTQDALGRLAVVGAIIAGAAVSYALGAGGTIPGGHTSIALASAAAFLFSEAADFAVYTPLRSKSWLGSVFASNTVGSAIDSAVFLYLAFGGLAFWKGQFVGKMSMTALAIIILYLVRASSSRVREAVAEAA